MKIVSDLSDGYWNRDVDEFLHNLAAALDMLDTLAQVQAIAGGSSMQHRAHQTENVRACLLNVLPPMRQACEADAKRMKECKR